MPRDEVTITIGDYDLIRSDRGKLLIVKDGKPREISADDAEEAIENLYDLAEE
jgi:hypothetical protein